MKLKEIIIDADFCIKIGASSKYRYLERDVYQGVYQFLAKVMINPKNRKRIKGRRVHFLWQRQSPFHILRQMKKSCS